MADDSSDSGSEGLSGSPDEQERQHFLDVCWSLMDYLGDAKYDLSQIEELMKGLDPADLALCQVNSTRFSDDMKQRVEANARFLAQLPSPDVCGLDLGPHGNDICRQIPQGYRVASRNSSKVRSTLRQFVRDWAVEGQEERNICYGPLIRALLRYMPPPPRTKGKGKNKGGYAGGGNPPKVLCPGSGLGRLPFELARLGYAAQGNEFSYHMLLGSHLVLNRVHAAKTHEIFPFILSTQNRRGALDHMAPVRIPDVAPIQALGQDSQLSMAAGEFVQVYETAENEFNAVATCFFLDTAKNVFQYIRLIALITQPGGLWINLGPLLFHYAEMPQEISIELSWEEIRPAIARYYDFIEEEQQVASYTTNPMSMMRTRYRCIFFVARRNSVEASGYSNPVF